MLGGKMTEILTRKEAAKVLKMSLHTLNYLVSANQIPYSRLGKRSVRFSQRRLMEWMKEREGIEYRLNKGK
jgi:excisionase family DNA binding protein